MLSYRARVARRALQERVARRAVDENAFEWQVPRWLDIAGSWLFGRFVRHGGRIDLERERPAGLGTAVDVTAAKVILREIKQISGSFAGSAVVVAGEASELASDLVKECAALARRVNPLLAKMARLNEGVLVSRTIGLNQSLESELDAVERQVDELRAQAREYTEMLTMLLSGLKVLAQGEHTAELDSAIQRVREFSNGVRRWESPALTSVRWVSGK